MFDIPIPWADEVYRQLLQFYLFECPTPELSARGIPFADLGWETTEDRAKLKKSMLEAASENLVYKSCETKAEVAVAAAALTIGDETVLSTERVVFYIGERHVMDALYAHIRNAFAHGRFLVSGHGNDAIYVLEDLDRSGVLTARLILAASTLTSWMRIVRGTPTALGTPSAGMAT